MGFAAVGARFFPLTFDGYFDDVIQAVLKNAVSFFDFGKRELPPH